MNYEILLFSFTLKFWSVQRRRKVSDERLAKRNIRDTSRRRRRKQRSMFKKKRET